MVERVFQSVRFEEQGYDACLAVLRLTNKYKAQRVEAACRMALDSDVRSPRYAHVKPILETNQDKIAAAAEADAQCRQPATCAAPTTTEATSMCSVK